MAPKGKKAGEPGRPLASNEAEEVVEPLAGFGAPTLAVFQRLVTISIPPSIGKSFVCNSLHLVHSKVN